MEIRTIAKSLLPSTCVCSSIAQCSRGSVGQLAKKRYATMADALEQMITDENGELDLHHLLCIQVIVKVTQRVLVDFNSSNDLIEEVLSNVVQKIQDVVTSSSANGVSRSCSGKNTRVEEGVYLLELKADMSLSLSEPPTKQDLSNALSPEKTGSSYAKLKRMQPSPVRKLVLGSTAESEDEEDEEQVIDSKSTRWKLVSTKILSETNAICVVDIMSSKEVVLDVTFNVSDRVHPASPTTGLRMPPSNAPFAEMNVAKSGFALLAVGGGLLSVGGFTRDEVLSTTEFYNFHFNCWNNSSDLNTKRARFAAVKCDGLSYIIGGSDGKNELGSIEIYNSKSCTWEKTSARMVTPRSCFDAATLDGRVYAVGGMYYSTPLRSAEVYDPSSQKWKPLPTTMRTSRYGLSVATCCGKIYAIGGQTLGWNCLSTVECYDPMTMTWSKVASMKTPRRNAACVSVDGKIYVIGGYNGSAAVNLVEVYDPLSNQWRCLPPMNMKRSSASAVCLNNSIYVAGGYSGSSFLNSVERYDILTDQWTSYV